MRQYGILQLRCQPTNRPAASAQTGSIAPPSPRESLPLVPSVPWGEGGAHKHTKTNPNLTKHKFKNFCVHTAVHNCRTQHST